MLIIGLVDEKLKQFATYLGNNSDKKIIRIIIGVLKPLAKTYDTLTEYTERKVHVYVNRCSVFNDDLNKYVSIPDTINGYVINRFGKAYTFNKVPYEKIDYLIEQFQEDNKKMIFHVDYGGGWYMDIPLNKWGRKEMSKKLIELKSKEDSR